MTPEASESLISFFGPNMITINIDACHVQGLSLGRKRHRPHLWVPGSSLRPVSLWCSVQDLRQRLEFDSAGSPASS